MKWISPARSTILRPTSIEPVNAIKSTSGLDTRCSPTSSPGPGRNCRTPVGSPESLKASNNFQPVTGDRPEGLKITQFPVTIPAEAIPAGMARGKFHGDIMTPTPLGS